MPRVRTLAVVAPALLATLALILWQVSRPPAIARMLPEADAILFADLRPIRLATHLDRDLPARSADYQRFVDATGIVPERDLDEAAFALTRRADPAGGNGPVAYTEILEGRFDAGRLERYLGPLASGTESYAGHTVFTVHMADPAGGAGRDVRVAVVRPGLLAISNAPTPEQLHSILDHARNPLPTAAPSLLAEHFAELPRFSPVWGLGRLGLPFRDPAAAPGSGAHIALFGLTLPISDEQTMLLSVRYLGVLRLRVELLSATPDAALEQAAALTSLAGLARTLMAAGGSGKPAAEVGAVLDSVRIEQRGERAVVTATLPLGLLRQLSGVGGATR